MVRDLGLLSSAAARPATVAFGVEAYEDVWTKAGALLHSVVLNHATVDEVAKGLVALYSGADVTSRPNS